MGTARCNSFIAGPGSGREKNRVNRADNTRGISFFLRGLGICPRPSPFFKGLGAIPENKDMKSKLTKLTSITLITTIAWQGVVLAYSDGFYSLRARAAAERQDTKRHGRLTVGEALRYSEALYRYEVVADHYITSQQPSKKTYWDEKIENARGQGDIKGVNALSALRNMDIRPLAANILINKETGQGILICGGRGAGKSLLTAKMLGFGLDGRRRTVRSRWMFGGDDMLQGFFVRNKLLAGVEPDLPQDAKILSFRNRLGEPVSTSGELVERFARVKLIIFLNPVSSGKEPSLNNEQVVEKIEQLHAKGELSKSFCRKLVDMDIVEIAIPEDISLRDYNKVVRVIEERWSRMQDVASNERPTLLKSGRLSLSSI